MYEARRGGMGEGLEDEDEYSSDVRAQEKPSRISGKAAKLDGSSSRTCCRKATQCGLTFVRVEVVPLVNNQVPD